MSCRHNSAAKWCCWCTSSTIYQSKMAMMSAAANQLIGVWGVGDDSNSEDRVRALCKSVAQPDEYRLWSHHFGVRLKSSCQNINGRQFLQPLVNLRSPWWHLQKSCRHHSNDWCCCRRCCCCHSLILQTSLKRKLLDSTSTAAAAELRKRWDKKEK